jgi:SNF2 family DNA or RNA helicase
MTILPALPFRINYSPADSPLVSFYIPALKASVRYDRMAGFFSSSALAVAAEGVAHLIQNGGRMRLLVGADLSEEDVNAIQSGYDLRDRVSERLLDHFADPQDALMQQRFEVLAWMIANGTLEIKVVLPLDAKGTPLAASQCQEYFHAKGGVFEDAEGNQIAFTGSINESETAWLKNFETFMVYFSWDETKKYLAQIRIDFEQLWAGKTPDWIALDIPQAVKDRLLRYRPPRQPDRDPLEAGEEIREEPPQPTFGQEQRERVIFQFLRDAPHLVHAAGLGAATSAVSPWPHQTRVADSVIRRFPERVLLCNEVGLGKTIEAGLVLRQLVLTGRIKTCLILAPKSVVRQWQEELYEKFALRVPIYDGSRYWDLHDRPLPDPGGNPWTAFPILIAGSQLAKRKDRRDQLTSCAGWDLLLVDEAHHARRKDFKDRSSYRPNQLLSLIQDLSEREKFSGLILMTATPMQVHPLEVWDLLKLLGMGARWGADEENFLQFFAELQKSFDQIDWDFIFDMVADELNTGGTVDTDFSREAQTKLGPVKWDTLKELPYQKKPRTIVFPLLGSSAQPLIKELARRHTPIKRFVYRNTRELLKEYQRKGILKANVPARRPKLVHVDMRTEEFELYERIDEYISHFYQKYENEKHGLGFIMTVYRRRLTSSFYAIRCSLERRMAYLKGEIGLEKAFDDDDLEQDELTYDVGDEEKTLAHERFKGEIEYIKTFLKELRTLSEADSKLQRLKDELNEVFKQRNTVLVFTQYTDTMDYLRDQLKSVYGSEVACYSGRGGEVWNGISWVPTTKEFVKTEFKEGRIRILLCTESASEGLNLQTCGVLINYDMPWNPMRVEQRIGRIDRIGQLYQEVWISNYFYTETIEDTIYKRLSDRIAWFEVVVGALQPILMEVGEVTRRLAMLPEKERASQLESEIDMLEERLEQQSSVGLDLDTYTQSEENPVLEESPVTLSQLEKVLTSASTTAHLFRQHETIRDAYYLLIDNERYVVTFSPTCFDEHPDSALFMTYGNPLLERIFGLVPLPDLNQSGELLRCENVGEVMCRGWYTKQIDNPHPQEICTFYDLEKFLDVPIEASTSITQWEEEAERLFQGDLEVQKGQQLTIVHHRRKAVYLSELENAKRLLIKAAIVEIALGRQPEILETMVYPAAFTSEAVQGLQRHNYPWSGLVKLAFSPGLSPSESDEFFTRIRTSSRESLKSQFAKLTEIAKSCLWSLKKAKDIMESDN